MVIGLWLLVVGLWCNRINIVFKMLGVTSSIYMLISSLILQINVWYKRMVIILLLYTTWDVVSSADTVKACSITCYAMYQEN